MSVRVTKNIISIHRKKFYRSFTTQQNVNKNNKIQNKITFNSINKNFSSQYVYSKNFHGRSMCQVYPFFTINFQRRNISNESFILKDFDELKKSSDLPLIEEHGNIIRSQVPEFLKGFSDWKIVELAQQTFLNVHEISGLPWWASITLTAFVARTCITLPFSIITIRNTAKIEMIQLEMKDIVKKLQTEANYACNYHHWPENLARQHYNKAVKKEFKNLIVRDNCHPAKSMILLLIQLPMWFSFSIAARNLCYMLPKADIGAQITYMQLTAGGFGWVKNLVDVDHYLILPFTLAFINLAIFEVHQMFNTNPSNKLDRWRKVLFRGISVIMIPIAASVPAAMNIYWLSSSLFGLFQAFLLNSLRLRRFFRVPITSSESEHPYRLFFSKLKSKFNLAKK